METNHNDSTNQRRDFLKTAAISVTAAACGSAICACGGKDKAAGEKVVLLSPDGELVTIDSAHLRPVPKTIHVSNAEDAPSAGRKRMAAGEADAG
jgi:hypothetical protein